MTRIVLDIDDTLYLERDYVASGFRAVGNWLMVNHGEAGFFEKAYGYFLAGRRGDIFNRVLRDINIGDDGLLATMVEVYRSHIPDIRLLPDADSFLLKHDPGALAIVSDGYPVSQWAKVRALGLEARVGTILVTDDWGAEYRKPNTRAFEEAQKGYSPHDCVYIADNPAKDFIAPATLGWLPSIRIRRRDSLHVSTPTPADCLEVESLNEVPPLLLSNLQP